MTEVDSEADEQKLDALHAALARGEPVLDVVGPWGKIEGKRIIDIMITEFIGELNRALASAGEHPYGVNASLFLRRYSLLWEAKLAL